MPDKEPNEQPGNEEPDEELFFPNFDLSEIERLNPSMVDKTFDALIRQIRSQRVVIKYQRKVIKSLNQDKIILKEQYKALEESNEIKQSHNAQTHILTAITSIVVTIGGGFLFASQVLLGLVVIFIGLLLAWITAHTYQVSKSKQRKDSK